MRRLALSVALLSALFAAPALAQSPNLQSRKAMIAPTAAPGDNSNRIATTAFVQAATGGSLVLQSGRIFIGSAGNIAVGQPVTGDCTISISGVVTCTQSAGGFTINGALSVTGGELQANITAPSTPVAGKTQVYVDSTQKVLSAKNDAGTVSNTVVASSAAAHQFANSISAAGVIGYTQPAFADLSGQGTCAQEPALTGFVTTAAGSCATALGATITIAQGGTGQITQQAALNALAPTPTRAGDLMYWNGTNWVSLAGNNSGTQFLQETAAGVPSWATVSGTGTVTTLTAGGGITFSSGATCTTTCTVSLSVQPNFRVHLAGNQSITASTYAKVLYDTVDIDSNSFWSAANHNFLPTVAGTYQFCTSALATGTYALNSTIAVQFSKNGLHGTGTDQGTISHLTGGANTSAGVAGCTIAAMNGSTDTMEVDMINTATTPAIEGSTAAAIQASYLTGIRIGQ
jgi:hypothetical protein